MIITLIHWISRWCSVYLFSDKLKVKVIHRISKKTKCKINGTEEVGRIGFHLALENESANFINSQIADRLCSYAVSVAVTCRVEHTEKFM